MRLLLDTHIFLWFIVGDQKLAIRLREAIANPENEVFLSVISLWEIIIKYKLGHLPLPLPPEIYVPAQRELFDISSLPVDEGSVFQVAKLPPIHRDPFDRLLIGQAIEHNLRLVTVDTAISAYPMAPVF
ncbi:MAG: type II toxin-antitoxin system VapC family toxin [Janthinobacterium lividum]